MKVLALLIFPLSCFGQLALTTVDTEIAPVLTQIIAQQELYRGTNSVPKYWQGLRTATTRPTNGVAENVTTTWPRVSLPAQLRSVLECDEYLGPAGPGYAVSIYCIVTGTNYMRRVAGGSVTNLAMPWTAQGSVIRTNGQPVFR